MEYIIPRKLIGLNINFSSVYLEFLNVLSWKTIEKISIRYSGNKKTIITGIIFPKELQIQFLKFYSRDWLFLKFSNETSNREVTIS